jgi:hypothetical protein
MIAAAANAEVGLMDPVSYGDEQPSTVRALGLIALGLCVAAGAWAVCRSSTVRGFLSRLLRNRRPSLGSSASRRESLRQAIVGKSKHIVAKVFGAPRTALFRNPSGPQAQQSSPPPFWQADTWYYAIDPRERVAMAIRFDQELAREVEFIEAEAKQE